MKTIEQCLDIILKKLIENWNLPEEKRISLKGEEILAEFNLPEFMQKHEFFKRLILRLIKDNYAEPVGKETLERGDELSKFENATLITIEGYYFITEKNGYEGELKRQIIK